MGTLAIATAYARGRLAVFEIERLFIDDAPAGCMLYPKQSLTLMSLISYVPQVSQTRMQFALLLPVPACSVTDLT